MLTYLCHLSLSKYISIDNLVLVVFLPDFVLRVYLVNSCKLVHNTITVNQQVSLSFIHLVLEKHIWLRISGLYTQFRANPFQ